MFLKKFINIQKKKRILIIQNSIVKKNNLKVVDVK